MAKEHVERLRLLLRPVTEELPPDVEAAIKPFFGGAAAYANGRICVSLTTAGLALKLPEGWRNELMESGGKPLRYFPHAPVKKQYVVVPPLVHEDEDKWKLWARRSIDHVLALPRPLSSRS